MVTSFIGLDFTWTESFSNFKYKNLPTCLFWLQVVWSPTCPVWGGTPLTEKNPLSSVWRAPFTNRESCCDVWFHVSNFQIVLSSLRKRTKHDWDVEIKNNDVFLRSTLHVSFFSELSVQSFFYFYEQRILQFTEASLIVLHMYIYIFSYRLVTLFLHFRKLQEWPRLWKSSNPEKNHG